MSERRRSALADLGRALAAEGFTAQVDAAGSAWSLSPADTRRVVTVRVAPEDGERDLCTIDVEEWRGGEGYEAEELRTRDLGEAIGALARWSAWAREPFVESWSQRRRRALGGPLFLLFYPALVVAEAASRAASRLRRRRRS